MKNNNSSMTRADVSDILYKEIGLPYSESMNILDSVLDEISNALSKGESVKVSSFGTFSVKEKKERIGRNPKTGVEAVITPRRVISFKPSHNIKDKVLNGNKSES